MVPVLLAEFMYEFLGSGVKSSGLQRSKKKKKESRGVDY